MAEKRKEPFMSTAHLPFSCDEVRELVRHHLRPETPSTTPSLPCDHESESSDGICEECLVQMLPELLDLVCSDHEQPASHFAPTIRRMIEERWFIDENGDSVVDLNLERMLDHKVGVLVTVLEELQQRAVRQGEWSNLPAAQIMCG
jgi:hypothetical protein